HTISTLFPYTTLFRSSYRNTMVGFIFQEYNILNEFSVAQNIGLALSLQGQKVTEDAINDLLIKLDIAGLGNRSPNELSGGQKQRSEEHTSELQSRENL